MPELLCFLNGRFIPLSEATIPVNDLGLQRGYGIFDFLRVTDGAPLFWEDHLDRFYQSAEMMRLSIRYSRDEMRSIIKELLQRNGLANAGIKLLLTGGPSSDGYQMTGETNLLISEQLIPPPPDTIFLPGYKLISYEHQRQVPEVKTTDYLMAIRLQPWVKENGADDILYHQNEMVSECPRSNFFIITKDDRLVTPAKNILKGITRKQLLAIASNIGIHAEERAISLNDVRNAKEAFITSSTKRLIPVTQVDDIFFAPFSEVSVTARLYNAFKEWELSAIHGYR
ncbi:MAG: amino acid aminotransferase [Sediminibacterium sp.]|nr:amino acid aminotransferase [Sediminibacterium sp.]